jgi:hypothetical protein
MLPQPSPPSPGPQNTITGMLVDYSYAHLSHRQDVKLRRDSLRLLLCPYFVAKRRDTLPEPLSPPVGGGRTSTPQQACSPSTPCTGIIMGAYRRRFGLGQLRFITTTAYHRPLGDAERNYAFRRRIVRTRGDRHQYPGVR